jgi:Cu+-exporting ATPase
MHRELSYADQHFQQESRLSLYVLTAALGVLLLADLWPILAAWIATWGPQLPAWPNTYYGYRLALIAAVIGGARALYGSIDSLLQGKIGADLALAIACIAAILLREHLVAAEIVFIGLVGECLESITFERTQRAVRNLIEICPRRCWRLRDGKEEAVLVTDLQPGDLVLVKPGKRVPADGIVREGRSAVDQSALTGESLPVDKGPGDEVLAGSLNQMGALTVEARRVAEHTVVGRVIELTARALKDKAPTERTADRLARWFLPAVLAVALVTLIGGLVIQGGGWFRPATAPRLSFTEALRVSAYPALAVLVVACPCALILATPAAVIAALGRLAGTGVLIKGGSALERLAGVTAIAFDKTGTLTEARLSIGDVVPVGDVSGEEVLRLAASAEQKSEHVLAQLLLREAHARHLSLDPVDEFHAHPGLGLIAATASHVYLVGNRRLMQERGVPLSPEIDEALARLDASGQTALLLARASRVEGGGWRVESQEHIQKAESTTREGDPAASSSPSTLHSPPSTLDAAVLGIIGVRDTVRAEAAGVLAELRSIGIGKIAILTGDREAVARAVAGSLGVTEVHAELLPDQKAAFIANWQAAGERVAMVGDGINDAPALARADVGIAIGGTGVDLAAEAGDVVFMGDPLRPLPLLVRLSRQTVRIIRQNIVWFAFVVNAVGVVFTAWLWPIFAPAQWYEQSPVVAVIYHQLGSLAVLLNAMRLLWFERAPTKTWQNLEGRFVRLNAWLERYLNLDEALHWLSHRWKKGLAAVGIAAVLIWIASGYTQIEADELGIVLRFGRPLAEDLEPGPHWCWPWPIDRVVRVQPDRARTLELGFRTVERPGKETSAVPETRAWSSQHGGDVRRIPDEAVMITGDGYLIEVQGSLRFVLSHPRAYLFEVSDPESILRAALESVLRELIASRTFATLLTTERAELAELALVEVAKRCKDYGPEGLGVRLDSLALHDLHPPPEVVDAYHQVAVAMEHRDQKVNEASAAVIRSLAEQYGVSLQTRRKAEGQRYDLENLAGARKDAFVSRARARGTLSLKWELRLLLDALAATADGQDPEKAARAWRISRQALIGQQELLTDYRLTSDAVADSVGSRDRMFLDGLSLPSWLQLWMVLGEQRRTLLPGLDGGEIVPRRPVLPERSPFPREP